ncbi:UDP-4-amino-4,6-dideoxy-N-acetyl-beta-L-altrosamine N-acetyltransferase [Devosia sp. WQ 349]|uniref:UDP-4-amino-4, 6-dideoxy-N-acetyl-beta-L-altrosamine N-acetyltransferase n=1 Tax=Devosia sp. WQ 349K1 TaxID=2800329 RepID=UPI00190439F1|nr:UDP-4-amino-4,6-dideoxy-N-acetyl-beta-L-altrosamine N-acetyltransferase [Devosia sp. WQ 349K1]MBK1796006.1 UDP-4-amino-4,6-dideoxy-N-acetyl-beta-L-altrosamine N-acetyltransferase [Devosia sp. WQ 349K1]
MSVSDLGELRAIRTQELKMMLDWRNAPSVRANMYTRHEISLVEHLAWWEKVSARDDQLYLMYEYAGIPSGIVAFNGIDRSNQGSGWAFYSAPEAARGAGGRMEFLALDYAFGELALHKLSCEVLAFNSAVIKLHKKFGFQVEGIFRDHHKINDAFEDIYRLAILKREWTENRSTLVQKITRRREP